AVEQALEGDGAGVRTVIEEDGNAAALIELDEIRMGGIDGGVGGADPLREQVGERTRAAVGTGFKTGRRKSGRADRGGSGDGREAAARWRRRLVHAADASAL